MKPAHAPRRGLDPRGVALIDWDLCSTCGLRAFVRVLDAVTTNTYARVCPGHVVVQVGHAGSPAWGVLQQPRVACWGSFVASAWPSAAPDGNIAGTQVRITGKKRRYNGMPEEGELTVLLLP